MKVTLALLLLATTINAIPVSLRFIFMPKTFNNDNINEDNYNNGQSHHDSDLMESRMDQRPSPFTFVEPMMEQPQPFGFPAQARIAVAPAPALFTPELPQQTMQRRMDADEELLSQMPYSPQRRMDEGEPHLVPQGMPLIHVNGEMNQPMPFLIQMPMTERNDQEHLQHQQPQQQQQIQLQQPIAIPINQGEALPIPLSMPVQSPPIQFRALPIMAHMPREDDMERNPLELEETDVEEIQDREEITDEDDIEAEDAQPPVIPEERQRILVIESAARLRPVIVDSLQTVMQLFNAVAPQVTTSTAPTPSPETNFSARADVKQLAQKLDKSLESLTLQVADALGTLTAHAKQLLPMLLKNNNTVKGIVDDPIAERSDDINEIKTDASTEMPLNAQNLTETVSRYVQLNSEEFRRTWKHFLHHYWTYVQKIFETAQ